MNNSYNFLNFNSQNFVSDLFQTLCFQHSFNKYEGPIGDYIKYFSDDQNLRGDVYPTLIISGDVIASWKSHSELDAWTIECGHLYKNYVSLLKGFHRGFQIKGDCGYKCIYGKIFLSYFIYFKFNFFLIIRQSNVKYYEEIFLFRGYFYDYKVFWWTIMARMLQIMLAPITVWTLKISPSSTFPTKKTLKFLTT